jgi:hypothetical protein
LHAPCAPKTSSSAGQSSGVSGRMLSRRRGLLVTVIAMALYPIVVEMKKLLVQMTTWIDKAEAHAASKGYEQNVLLQARLAPDMFPLVSQFQSACDNAKFAAAFTTGKSPPSHPDTEQTFAEIRARIASVIDYLGTFPAADFEGTDAQVVKRPRWEGRWMRATDYFVEQAMPNFFFHFTTAYAILRHNGVDLGKRDYLGKLSLRSSPPEG